MSNEIIRSIVDELQNTTLENSTLINNLHDNFLLCRLHWTEGLNHNTNRENEPTFQYHFNITLSKSMKG